MICPDCCAEIKRCYKLKILHQDKLHHDLTCTLERVGEEIVLGPTVCEDCGWSFPEQHFDPEVEKYQRRAWERYTHYKRQERLLKLDIIAKGFGYESRR